MSVVSVGIDLVDIDRIERMLARHGDMLMRRLLTDGERAYCAQTSYPPRHVAARIAAKEAAYKALQYDVDACSVGWQDSEVTLEGHGRPVLRLHGRAKAVAERLKVSTALLSLTHSNVTAAAVVVLVGEVGSGSSDAG